MLPEAFLTRMKSQLQEEYPRFLLSLERPRAVALRVNGLRGKIEHLPFITEPVPWEDEGYYYDPQTRPGLHPYHEAGVYYLQEASAMAPVVLLDPQPDEWVCDLCAAPGGKSTQIASRMQGKGFLLCNEINSGRAKILSRNIERMGVANALVTNEHPQVLSKKYKERFDRVLIDAPCSGEGMFRKEEAAVTDWSLETVQMCARRQLQILESGAELVRPGGRLVYSTCTFSPEENEEVIARFLSEHPEFSPEEMVAPWFTSGSTGMYRMWPHKLLGEGHFAAVLHKTGQPETRAENTLAQKIPNEWIAFAKQMDIVLPAGKIQMFGQSVYWAPTEMPDISGVRVLRPGLELGEVRKGRFTPAHALALWLKTASCVQNFDASDAQIGAYLHGETVPSDRRGWCLVTVDGFSIGWGKGDGKILKNHYPKGLRR